MQCRARAECFFFFLRSGKSATVKLFEIICFANFVIFHIYFESKYLEKL